VNENRRLTEGFFIKGQHWKGPELQLINYDSRGDLVLGDEPVVHSLVGARRATTFVEKYLGPDAL